jgi:hypothetical protein
VHWDRTTWRAYGCFVSWNEPDTVEIDKLEQARWVHQATVVVRGGLWTYLGAAELTHSGVPDFIVSTGQGADWIPFSVIARFEGTWQLVPFDPEGLGDYLIDAQLRVRDGLVHSYVANGGGPPATSLWYRFDGQRFVPTQPPGPAPLCTGSALDRARALIDPQIWPRPVAFRVARFACLDGWALAVNTNGGYALYNQQAARWHRASTGTLQFTEGIATVYALPADLFATLEQRIELHSGYGKG